MDQRPAEAHERVKKGPWPVDVLVRLERPFLTAETGPHWFTVAGCMVVGGGEHEVLSLSVLVPGSVPGPETRLLIVLRPGPTGQCILDYREPAPPPSP